MKRDLSLKTFELMKEVMPGGVSSPVRAFFQLGVSPVIIQKGEGAYLEDIDKNRYIDYCQSWGANLHGHAHPRIVEEAIKTLKLGSSFGAPTLQEMKLADLITKTIPSIEKVRFVSSGTEATMSACRLARAFTKRDYIVKFEGCYHGHSDQFLSKAGSFAHFLGTPTSLGVPSSFTEKTYLLPYNDKDAVKRLFQEHGMSIAALIVEPVACNMGVVLPEKGFLDLLRSLTKEYESLLIFDEVITGFRLSHGSAGELYNITPDLTCLGKIMGGGYPAAGYGGRKEIMELLAPLGSVFQAGTLSGNPVAMSAGLIALWLAQETGFYEELERKAERLLQPIEEFIEKHSMRASLQRCQSMFTLFFGTNKVRSSEDLQKLDHGLFRSYYLYMLEKGVYMPPMHNEAAFISSAHKDNDLDYTRDSMLSFLKSLI
jgi:glutamate-1-semialdehyde 2,1-aminomutase